MSTNYKKLIQDIFEQHNIIRTNPSAYIPILEKQISYFKGDVIIKPGSNCGISTSEGKSAYQECINFLKKQKAIGKLELNENLSKAAQDHVDDIGPKGICDHTGSDDSGPSERIERYIDWGITMGENIDFGAHTGQEIIISLIVDDGVPDRGHRNSIFNPKFKFVGIGCGKHEEYQSCTVLDYVGEINGVVNSTVNKIKQGLTKSNYSNSNINTKDNSKYNSKETSKIVSNDINKAKNEVNILKDLMKEKLKMKANNNNFNCKNDEISDDYKPNGTVKTEIKTKIVTKNNKRVTTTIKTFTLKDGSQEIVEEVVTEEL